MSQVNDQTGIVACSVAELMARYRAKSLSPLEVADAYLGRIAAHNSDVNAYCFVDPDATRQAAKLSEQRFLDGVPLGPLDGIPVAVKDLLLTKGWPTLRGSKVVSPDQPWQSDAPAVARLRAQGMVFLGKTTTPEFGWKGVTDSTLTGVTRNPWNQAMTSGGSSGGSAAAVAAGLAPLALGTDGGGSIRIPSSFCGIVGLKPTVGSVPQWPPSPFGILAHLGPHARSADDAGLLFAALANRSVVDPPAVSASQVSWALRQFSGLKGMKIAYSPDLGYVNVRPDIAHSVDGAVADLGDLGALVTRVDPGFDDPIGIFETLWYSGATRLLRDLSDSELQLVDPGLVEIADVGSRKSSSDYLEALQQKVSFTGAFDDFMDDYDLLVTPTVPLDAFEVAHEVPTDWPSRRWMSWTPFTYPFNISGNPAITVFCGLSDRGLPIGLQFVGHRGQDHIVLGAAADYEKQFPPPFRARVPN